LSCQHFARLKKNRKKTIEDFKIYCYIGKLLG